MGSSCHSPVTYVPISCHLYLPVPSLFPAHIYLHLPISTSVVFASHWQWLRYAFHLLISSLLMSKNSRWLRPDQEATCHLQAKGGGTPRGRPLTASGAIQTLQAGPPGGRARDVTVYRPRKSCAHGGRPPEPAVAEPAVARRTRVH